MQQHVEVPVDCKLPCLEEHCDNKKDGYTYNSGTRGVLKTGTWCPKTMLLR